MHVQVDAPRAFGHAVGDVIRRRIVVDAPAGSLLDRDSLPRPVRSGQALELQAVSVRDDGGSPWPAARMRIEIDLAYQVFHAPVAVRTLEMPPLALRMRHGGRTNDLRVEAWPVAVAPLTPPEAATREGLGELRPDDPPPVTASLQAPARIAAYGIAALLAMAYLGWVLWGWPWAARRDRPFQRAWRDLRALPAQAARAERRGAMQRLHAALNDSAGRVLFERDLAAFLAGDARFAPLADELARFFGQSRREFFDDVETSIDATWLRQLARRLRDAERGLA